MLNKITKITFYIILFCLLMVITIFNPIFYLVIYIYNFNESVNKRKYLVLSFVFGLIAWIPYIFIAASLVPILMILSIIVPVIVIMKFKKLHFNYIFKNRIFESNQSTRLYNELSDINISENIQTTVKNKTSQMSSEKQSKFYNIFKIVLFTVFWPFFFIYYIIKSQKLSIKQKSIFISFISCFLIFIALITISNPKSNSSQSFISGSVNNENKPIDTNRINLENEEKRSKEIELVKLKESAQTINQTFDFNESNKGEPLQKLEDVKIANLNISGFGLSTKDKKLFDVISVIDGDTIKISELGTVRLIGIDAPETKDPRKTVQCYGQEAFNYLKDKLLSKKVYLEFEQNNRIDKYNRTLAFVYLENGYFVNKEIIKDGYAFAYLNYQNTKLEEFKNLQKTASDNKLGLWAENTCNGEYKDIALIPETPKVIVVNPVVSNQNQTTTPKPLVQTPIKPNPTATATTNPVTNSNCEPSYPDLCIPIGLPDLDCPDIKSRNFRVIGSDPHRFDGKPKDGFGCEKTKDYNGKTNY